MEHDPPCGCLRRAEQAGSGTTPQHGTSAQCQTHRLLFVVCGMCIVYCAYVLVFMLGLLSLCLVLCVFVKTIGPSSASAGTRAPGWSCAGTREGGCPDDQLRSTQGPILSEGALTWRLWFSLHELRMTSMLMSPI